MNHTNKIGALALAAAAAVTLTACDPGPSERAAASSSAAANSSVAVAAGGGDLPPGGVAVYGRAYAAAMERGVPFIYGIPGGPNQACHAGLVIPQGLSGAGEWTLNKSSVTVAGSAFDRGTEIKQYGCSFDRISAEQAAQTPVSEYAKASMVRHPDAEAKAAAEGRPYIRALPSEDGVDPACHTVVTLPDGTDWYMNTPGDIPATGIALEREQRDYVCRKGL
ncbi:hypothetical protein [Mycolicibacterium llatzerense]|uniref:hypothetical protein n=1 Tax=Mycolicibacterium llatzerense TaxID=280871 RepID=UPI0008DE1111|nr:hypothetical protein [Mycolicibacterium llatzerense]